MKLDTTYLKENALHFPKIFYKVFDDGIKGVSTIINFNSREHVVGRVYENDVTDEELTKELHSMIVPPSISWFKEYQVDRLILIKDK